MKLGPVVAELLAALIVVGMFLTSVIFWFVGDFSGTIANTPKIVLSDATKTSDSPQIAVGYGNNTYQGNGVFAVWRDTQMAVIILVFILEKARKRLNDITRHFLFSIKDSRKALKQSKAMSLSHMRYGSIY